MKKEEREYLQKLASIKTPTIKRGMADDTYEEICYAYCQIRNGAKDALLDFNQERLDSLKKQLKKVKKLEEISKKE